MSRRRRSPEEARAEILAAAEALLREGGVAAVQVRAVAARVGMTDAGVNHHFRGRAELLEALLRHGGRRLRAAVEETVESWLGEEEDLQRFIAALGDIYRSGYAELALSLHSAGWRDSGSGLLEPVVLVLHQGRRSPGALEDTRLAVAALHQALALEPVFGAAFRRSAGLTSGSADDPEPIYRWWAEHLGRVLDLPSGPHG
ncbi:MAG: TetR family transcriptional regulator [Myxococcota bacterium]